MMTNGWLEALPLTDFSFIAPVFMPASDRLEGL